MSLLTQHHSIIGAMGNGGGGDISEVEIGGKVYPVVRIGDLYWTALNLDYQYPGLVLRQGYNTNTPTAYYFRDDEATYGWNGKKYGLYYNKNAAAYLMEHPSLFGDGWRVSTESDWNYLESYVKNTLGYSATNLASALKNPNGWSGAQPMSNVTGFSALGTGRADYNYGWSWTAEKEVAFFAKKTDKARLMNNTGNQLGDTSVANSTFVNVRLVKDA